MKPDPDIHNKPKLRFDNFQKISRLNLTKTQYSQRVSANLNFHNKLAFLFFIIFFPQ